MNFKKWFNERVPEDIVDLSKIIESWVSGYNGEFGSPTVEGLNEELKSMKGNDSYRILTIQHENEPVGLIAVQFRELYGELFASELHWYVMPGHRGRGVKLLKKAEELASEAGCKYFLAHASHFGGMTKKTERVYKRFGYKPFSQSYIKAI